MIARIALIVALLLPVAARAEAFAFVDFGRVKQESTEAQRIAAEIQSDGDTKQREMDAARQAITQVKECQPTGATKTLPPDGAACQRAAAPLVDKYNALAKMNQADLAKHDKAAWGVWRKRVSDVTVKLQSARHVTILGAMPLVEDKRDLTDEFIRLLNASDVVAIAEERDRLKEENAKLKAANPSAPADAHK